MWTMQKAFTKLFASDNASPKKMPVVNVSPASPSSPRSVSSNPTSTGKSVASSPGSVISVRKKPFLLY